MTIISCHFEKSKQETFTLTLDCRDNRGHCTAVQPELDRVTLYADVHQWLQGGVAGKVGQVKLVKSLPDGRERWTGEEELLYSSPVGVQGAPTGRQGTYTVLLCSMEPSVRTEPPPWNVLTEAWPVLSPSPLPMVRSHKT